VPCDIKGFFDVQDHRSHRHFIVEIKWHVVRQIHTLQCSAVAGTETKLACVKQAFFLKVFFEKLQNYFLE
jgi:hypothetical protein